MTGEQCIKNANINELIGIPYSKLDCQALIEKILIRGGIQCKNFRGSNHMWREMVRNRRDKYTNITPGSNLMEVKRSAAIKTVTETHAMLECMLEMAMKETLSILPLAVCNGTIFPLIAGTGRQIASILTV